MSDKATDSKYKVIRVEKTTPPTGMLGDNWYLYVIQKGNLPNSIMECKKTGTLKAVTAHAKDVANTINLRNVKGGRK
ncbi:MAG: hypothetical protein DRQ44_17180 [Gammaproteobacteria bacterium]|nr:MAG: hypothetical protein DRQ44_17180 [Gammaproteobacteria bacterium]